MNRCRTCSMPCREFECSYCRTNRLRKESCKRNYKPTEPTMEELDQIIAEQMQCLPKWWDQQHGERTDLKRVNQ